MMLAKKGKKILAMLLALVMLMGLLPVSAMAAGTQLPPVTILHDGEQVTNEGKGEPGYVSVQKSIDPVSNRDDEFTITLDVTTTASVETVTQNVPADVVLVIDASGSMCEAINHNTSHSKYSKYGTSCESNGCAIYKAKEAAKDFAEEFLANNTDGKRTVSVVMFKGSGFNGANPKVETIVNQATSYSQVESQVDTITANGGTPTGPALKQARQLLNDSSSLRYIVLITDGDPTEDSWWGGISGFGGKSSARTQATAAKNSGIELYTIGCDTGNGFDEAFLQEIASSRQDEHGNWIPNYSKVESAELGDVLGQIEETVSNAAQAWYVTDPLSPYVTFKEFNTGYNYYQKGSNTPAAWTDGNQKNITWNMLNVEPTTTQEGGTTYYHYTLKYDITVPRTEDFYRALVNGSEEYGYTDLETGTKGLLTNGTTTLSYRLYQDSQEVGRNTIDFDVPAVTSEIPELPYRVEYYLQGDAKKGEYDSYTLDDTKGLDAVPLFTNVTLTEADPNYADKYADDYYSVSKTVASCTVSLDDSQNVLKVYYDHQTSLLTVNHYYKEIVIDADGTPSEGEYELKVTSYDGREGDLNAPLYAGERYTIGAEGNLGLLTDGGYSLDSTSLGGKDLTVELEPNNNTVDLYYSRTTDNSEAHVTVTHTYNTYSWVVETDQSSDNYGKLVPKLAASVDVPVADATVRLADQKSYSADLKANESYKDYVYVDGSAVSTSDSDVTVDSSKATIDLKVGENDLNLTFEYVPAKPTTISFTVEHYYTKNVTAIVDGEISHEGSFTDELGYTETITDYAPGEYYTLQEKTEYNGDIYTPADDNAGKLTGAAVDGEVIKLYYTLNESPAESTLTVVHVYRAWERYTEDDGVTESIRPATGVTVPESVTVEYPLSGTLYQGQNVTVTLKGEEGYTFTPSTDDGANIGPDAPVSDIAADGEKVPAQGQTIYVYYDAIPSDARDDAQITIVHHYTTLLDTVIGGVVTEDYRRDDGTSMETLTGQAGDPYSITERTEHEVGGESYTYTCVTSHADTGTFHSGTNTTIDLYYERSDSDLQAVTYNVVYEYYRQEMTFNDEGVAGYWDEPQKVAKPSGAPDDVTGASAYLGEKVSLSDGAVGNYTAYGENNLEPVIDAENKTITLKYIEQVAKTATTITVQHHYLETVLNPDNTVKETIDHTSGEVVIPVFVEQSYLAEAAVVSPYAYDRVEVSANLSGYDQNSEHDVTVTIPDGASRIDFYYTWTNSSAVSPASYTVNHYYRTVDWNEDTATKDYDPIGTGASYKTEGNSYAGLTITGTPDLKVDSTGNPVYTLDSATASSEFQGENYTIVLTSGSDNVINFYYTQYIDSRVGNETRVEVTHNYYARDTFTDVDDMTDADYIAQEGMKPEYSTTLVYDTIADGAWIGNSFTATQYPDRYTPDENGESTVKISYEFVNADPEGGKIDSLAAVAQEQPTPNVITINYIREYSTQPDQVTLTVNHQYYLDGVLQEDLTTSETHDVAYGTSVTAADYAKEKDDYSLDQSDAQSQNIASMTTAATITLKYYRTTPTDPGGGDGGDTTYYKVVVKYLEEGTEKSLRSDYSISIMETHAYDVTSRTELDISGYDRTNVTGDSLSMEHIDSDKEIIVWYVANGEPTDPGDGGDGGDGGEIDIGEPDTPLGPGPDGGTGTGDGGEIDIGEPDTPLGPGPDGGTDSGSEVEIDDAGVPKGDLPQTGAVAAPVNPAITAGLLALSMSMAALGLTFTFGRKKGEEED